MEEYYKVFYREDKILKCTRYGYEDELIERWQEDVYDDYSECRGYDTYLEGVTDEQTKELQDELNKVLQEWIKKHNLEANFGDIHNVEFVEEPLTDSCNN